VSDDETRRPTLRVIRGNATAEEIAALLAVVAARTAGGTRPVRPTPPASVWTDRSARTRRPLRPGPGAWSASGLPR
jgi:hypothetical protein